MRQTARFDTSEAIGSEFDGQLVLDPGMSHIAEKKSKEGKTVTPVANIETLLAETALPTLMGQVSLLLHTRKQPETGAS